MRLWWDDHASGDVRRLFVVGRLSVHLYDRGLAFGLRPSHRAVDIGRLAFVWHS